MTSEELHKKLHEYVGIRVRITSNATSSNNLWRDSYPELVDVLIRETDGAVCCKTADGVWSIVIEEGLQIDMEPAVGTFDFSQPVVQMEMIGAGITAYREAESEEPPTQKQQNRLDWSEW